MNDDSTKPIRFGTDGVRAEAGTWPLTAEGVQRMGRGIAAWAGGPGALVVVCGTPEAVLDSQQRSRRDCSRAERAWRDSGSFQQQRSPVWRRPWAQTPG